MSTIDQRESARYRQDVLRSYRAWRAYLEAQQTLLAVGAEAQSGLDAFEGANVSQERSEAAQQRITGLPAELRELFDSVYANERQQVQQQLDAKAPVRGGTLKRADPDEVARRALARLLDEARGLHRDDRRGLVPRGTPDAVQWLALDMSELNARPPSETDYQLAQDRQGQRRGVIINGALAALALIAILVLVLVLQQPGRQTTSSSAPTGNGSPLTVWPVTAVRDSARGLSFPLRAVETAWPEECTDAEQACWLVGSFRPVRVCLPAAHLAGLTTLYLDADEGRPSRVFDLSPAETGADLVVSPCDDTKDTAPRFGRLRAIEPVVDLAVGTAAPTGFTVTAITSRGQGEDTSIPDGQITLSIQIDDPDAARDWVTLKPTILLADGSDALPKETTREGTQLRLDYLIAAQLEPFDVLWQVAGADKVVRYRATLEPPPTRDAVLRARLRIEEIAVTPSQQTMAVTLTLHNTATTPIVVGEADLGFQTAATHREVAAPTLRQPLAPGEQRSVTLELPLEPGVLEIGPFRYELTVRG